MIVIGIVGGLILGLLAAARSRVCSTCACAGSALIFSRWRCASAPRFAIANGVQLADTLRLPLYAAAFVLLVCRRCGPIATSRALLAVIVGVAANGLAIVVNGG